MDGIIKDLLCEFSLCISFSVLFIALLALSIRLISLFSVTIPISLRSLLTTPLGSRKPKAQCTITLNTTQQRSLLLHVNTYEQLEHNHLYSGCKQIIFSWIKRTNHLSNCLNICSKSICDQFRFSAKK